MPTNAHMEPRAQQARGDLGVVASRANTGVHAVQRQIAGLSARDRRAASSSVRS
jgi:hypothetical protein